MYDICHAYRPGSDWVSQQALSINGKRKDINRKDLLLIGAYIKCKQAAAIIDEINEIVMQWKKFAKEVDVQPRLRDEIFRTHLRI